MTVHVTKWDNSFQLWVDEHNNDLDVTRNVETGEVTLFMSHHHDGGSTHFTFANENDFVKFVEALEGFAL